MKKKEEDTKIGYEKKSSIIDEICEHNMHLEVLKVNEDKNTEEKINNKDVNISNELQSVIVLIDEKKNESKMNDEEVLKVNEYKDAEEKIDNEDINISNKLQSSIEIIVEKKK